MSGIPVITISRQYGAGGREIARQLYYGLLQGAQRRSQTLRQRMEDAQPVLPERELEITQPELKLDTLLTIEL